MRYIALIFVFFSWLGILGATDYYSQGSLYANITPSWRDSGGNNPPNFTTAGNRFIVQNGHTMSASAQWVVSGTGSYVVIQTGGAITTGLFNHNIDLEMQNGAAYEVSNTSYSLLDATTWNAGSFFILNNSSINFRDTFTYGNLIVRNGTADVLGSSGITINGTLTLEPGGTFEGGMNTAHTNSIANIALNGGYFYGCTDGAPVTYNISGNIIVNSGYFFGSDGDGDGTVTYNISGDVLVQDSGFFYGAFRASAGDIVNTSYNVSGSFRCTGNNYSARNREEGGVPTYYLSGTAKFLSFSPATSTASCQHHVYIQSGASYTLARSINAGAYITFRINGTLQGANYQISSYGAIDPNCYIYGTFYTQRTAGLVGSASTAFNLNNSASLGIYSGSTIVYNASAAQAVTPLASYYTLNLTDGNKTLAGSATVNTALQMNVNLSISSGNTLTLNGSINGAGSILGGNLTVAGTASQLSLINCNIDQFTLSRSTGCYMNYPLTANTVNLIAGTLTIGTSTLNLNGLLSYNGGALAGGGNSTLNIGGSAVNQPLSAITLGLLNLSRANGCTMTGGVTTGILTLTSGALSIGANTLTLSGALNQNGGVLSGTANSIFQLTGSGNITIPVLTLGTLSLARTGNYCDLGGNLNTGNLVLSSGTLRIGTRTLTISTSFTRISGVLEGSSGSILNYFSNVSELLLPAITLYRFTLNGSAGCRLLGSLQVDYLVLTLGILNADDEDIIVFQSITASSGYITGGAQSALVIAAPGETTVNIPRITIGSLRLSGGADCALTASTIILSQLQLSAGNLSFGALARIADGAYIFRDLGTITDTPSFIGMVGIVYETSLTTGDEIPSEQGILGTLQVMPFCEITLDRGVYLMNQLFVEFNSLINTGEFTLYLDAACNINGENNARIFGNVDKDIATEGFIAPQLGIKILPGPDIQEFSMAHLEQSQILPNGASIARTWSLNGTLGGMVQVSFIWPGSADNDLSFSPSNLACVYRNTGSGWTQFGDPFDVSSLEPRAVLVSTDEFSQWTVGLYEEPPLPVTLSSFTAIPTQSNLVQLDWVTQSETGLAGFRVLRAESSVLAQALDLNILIPATNTSSQQQYTYTDVEAFAPATFTYWLMAVDIDGTSYYSPPATITLQEPAGEEPPPITGFPFVSMYPNPFNPILQINLAHLEDGILSADIYDLRGRRVRSLLRGWHTKGMIRTCWDATDDMGTECASGMYLLHFQAPYTDQWRKVVLAK